MEVAYLCGGCFWCIESVYNELKGIISVTSGYSGGNEVNPTYEEVKSQKTSHREAIKIEYDESIISYSTIIDIYLESVDPFDENGQFIDKGHSYSLAIFYLNDYQKEIAINKVKELELKNNKKSFIEIDYFKNFYNAEEYHQDYYLKNPEEFKNEILSSGRKENTDYKLLIKMLESLIEDVDYDISIYANTSALIFNNLKNLNWAGFYLLKGDELLLGPFIGHVACNKIKVGNGVCGTAVKEKKTIVVNNVHEFKGHIACDSASNSEIVIPFYKENKIIGVLDIDSPNYSRFSTYDKLGLESLVETLQKHL